MPNNIKRLIELLLKDIEELNSEAKQVEALILAAKQNKAADTIKSAVKSLALKKKEGKSLAATMISKSYRKKMAIDEKYKSFGDYMCTGLGQKASYRVRILEELRLRGTPNVIKNLYLYYCRFGAKSLGFEKGYCVKKILNSIFVNTGFKSTNFTTIHFKLCKFLEGSAGQSYMSLLRRKSQLRSEKKKGTYDTMEFENTKLENCLFEECDFFGVKFKNLNVGSLIQANQVDEIERIVEATRFYKCNFKFRTEFIYPNNTISTKLGLVDTKYDMTFSNARTILGRVAHNKDVINISRTLVTNSPHLIFEDCKFYNFVFMSQTTEANHATNPTLFLNCEFKGQLNRNSFEGLYFNGVKFIGCKFENIGFSLINFNKFKFEACELTNCRFENCKLIGSCCIIANTKLKETQFIQCIFSSYSAIALSCIITNDCILNEVSFIYCELINFVFNYESVKTGSKLMLNMKNCHFICNDLFGTNFDYCNLEGGDFAARSNCVEQINWLGRGFARISDPRIVVPGLLGGNVKKINISAGDILHDMFGLREDLMSILAIPGKRGVYQLKNRFYISKGYTNAEEFIASKNINAWDFIETYDGKFLYFIPPTSFNEANIKTCRFQGLDGFESFDFTKIAKDSAGRPNLNAANFTNVDLTNANMTNCNLIGTVFQVAKVTGVNFRDAVTNENTDFENTIDIGLAINAEHIDFGELQNNANETHARAQFQINNREKYKEFYALCQDPARLTSVLDDRMTKTIELYQEMIRIIKTEGNLGSEMKRNIKQTFDKFIIMILVKKVKYSPEQLRKLKTDFESIMSDELINILTSQQNPLRGGPPGKWCWLELVLDSLLFLFHCPSTYIFNFFEYYFFDIFNSHGAGGKSCTLGMVERLVNIHTQVSEKFLMSMDLEPTPSIVDTLKHYNEGNPSAVDDEITREFIIGFNDPSKLTPPNDCKGQLHRYALNKFVNLLKPGSTLAEEGTKDFGFDFDKTIKSEWRGEFQEAAKVEVNASRVQSLESLCEYFVMWMEEKILDENGYTSDIVDEIAMKGGDRRENFMEKVKELEDFLEENEIPNLKLAVIMMTSEEVTHEELIEYFEGGGKRRRKTAKKARGLSQKAKSFSLSKTKSLSSKKIKSAPAKLSLSKLDKLDRVIVQKFVKLPKEKVRKVFKKVCEPSVKFFSKKMSIEDREYREILEKKFKTMKINNLLLLEHEKVLKNYEKSMKKRFSSVSKSPKKTGSPRKSISISSRRNRKTIRSSRRPKRRGSLRTIRVSKKESSR
tara:strand:+ start:822 stop:4622 length:3801 start_codon:yes stop_codon:yes gene_type:complete